MYTRARVCVYGEIRAHWRAAPPYAAGAWYRLYKVCVSKQLCPKHGVCGYVYVWHGVCL
jgi:hypothetical protein